MHVLSIMYKLCTQQISLASRLTKVIWNDTRKHNKSIPLEHKYNLISYIVIERNLKHFIMSQWCPFIYLFRKEKYQTKWDVAT